MRTFIFMSCFVTICDSDFVFIVFTVAPHVSRRGNLLSFSE